MKTYTILTPQGVRFGPVLESVVRTNLRDGRYPVGTLALAEGMDDWVPLEELFPATPTAPEEGPDVEALTRTPWGAFIYNYRHWSFDGRATRREFFMTLAAVIVLSLVLAIPVEYIFFRLLELNWENLLTYFVLSLLPTFFMLPVAARRLHDSGHSGLWLLLLFFYPLGDLYLLYLFCLDSQYGNEYGPSAKYPN